MKSYTTIIDVIESRCNDISYETAREQFGIGVGTVYRIERIFRNSVKRLEELKGMEPPDVQALFYPD